MTITTNRLVWVPRVLLTAGLTLMCFQASGQPGSPQRSIAFADITGPVDPVTARFISSQIRKAEENENVALVLRIDTPGSLDVPAKDLARRIQRASVPVVAWVAPGGASASSAGTFIALAAHLTVMSPGATIGPGLPSDPAGRAGAASPQAAADARLLGTLVRGKSGGIAHPAIVGSRRLNADQASRLSLVQFSAQNLPGLLDGLSGRKVNIKGQTHSLPQGPFRPEFQEMPIFDRLLHAAVSPTSAYLLLLLGFFGLIFELYNPGVGGAGFFGGLALMFSLYGFSVLPTRWGALALLVLGLMLLLSDLQASGLGRLTAAGVLALGAGGFLLLPRSSEAFRLEWWAVLGGLAAALAFFFGAMPAAIRARSAKPLSGSENIVGTMGVARTDISPEGQVMAGGTLWKARTLGAAIGEGDAVEIKGVSGLMLVVERAKS